MGGRWKTDRSFTRAADREALTRLKIVAAVSHELSGRVDGPNAPEVLVPAETLTPVYSKTRLALRHWFTQQPPEPRCVDKRRPERSYRLWAGGILAGARPKRDATGLVRSS